MLDTQASNTLLDVLTGNTCSKRFHFIRDNLCQYASDVVTINHVVWPDCWEASTIRNGAV